MSLFGRMFGGKKGEKAPTTGEAIQELRTTEEMLLKKQEFLESKIENELTIARANGSKNKREKKISHRKETRKVKRMLFMAIVKPHVQYCSTLFNYATAEVMNEVQVALNDGMRAILNVLAPVDTHVTDMLQQLNMLKFKDMVFLDSMTMIYKIENDQLPPGMTRFFRRRRDVHDHETRGVNDFYVEFRKLQGACNSLFHKSVTNYNALDNEIKESCDVKEFRRKLTLKMKAQY